MDKPYVERRKIDPTRGDRLGDGTPNDADRIEIGPTQLVFCRMASRRADLAELVGHAKIPLGAANAAYSGTWLWRFVGV